MEVALLRVTVGHHQPFSLLPLFLAPKRLASLLVLGIGQQSVPVLRIGVGVSVESLIVEGIRVVFGGDPVWSFRFLVSFAGQWVDFLQEAVKLVSKQAGAIAVTLELNNIEVFAYCVFVVLHQEGKGLVQELSCVEFLVGLALHYIFLELGVMDCPLDEVSVHQLPLLNEIFLVLIFEVFHLFVLAFYGLTDANEPFQLRNLGLSIILVHMFKVLEEFIEDVFIFFEGEILLRCLFDVFDDWISKPIFLVRLHQHCFLQKR